MRLWLTRAALCTAALAVAVGVAADQWNDRTILTFSQPVMVPGATLAPGTYEFQIADTTSARHMIRVRNNETGQLVAMIQAVPTRRSETSGNIVLEFNPTEAGAPVALKAFFYPNSGLGHEFVYSDEQARHIAERTKTIVLSSDAPFGEPTSGALRTYDASGNAAEWKGDAEAVKSWDDWRRSRSTAAGDAAASQGDKGATQGDTVSQGDDKAAQGDKALAEGNREAVQKATAPAIVRAGAEGIPVEIGELEDAPTKYLGQRISVDAAVENVLGPRAFTIDEPNWIDLDGEIVVFMPTTLVALVNEDDRVTVTGTMMPFAEVEIDRDSGWFFGEPSTDIEIRDRLVLVADRLVGGNDDRALIIRMGAGADAPVGTAGEAAAASPIGEVGTVASGRARLVGRHVAFENVRVASVAKDGGFFVASGDRHLFVMPATQSQVMAGDQVSIDGVVMRMPRRLETRLETTGDLNDDIYVFALDVKK